ncbi:MAG: hypothetical protein NC223_02300 [Butyrivibrio sp.]|nr:hypothetical protein [Butyrivibrio sp.]
MKAIKMCLGTIFAASLMFSLTACGTKATDNNVSDSASNDKNLAAANGDVTSEADAEITESELMELAWWHEKSDEENGIDTENIYPGFELDCEIKDGGYYRVFRSKDKGIEVLEKLHRVEEGLPTSGGEIIIRNDSEISKEYSVVNGIGNTNNKEGFTRDEKKLFFLDLTNNGQEELVISIPNVDMETNENYVYVFDSESLEQIALPDEKELRGKVESGLESVKMQDAEDGRLAVSVTIEGRSYEAYTDLFEEWSAEDMEYKAAVSGYGGFYVGASGAYYRAGIYIYHKDYERSVNNRYISVDIPLAYSSELNAFEAADGEYTVSGGL